MIKWIKGFFKKEEENNYDYFKEQLIEKQLERIEDIKTEYELNKYEDGMYLKVEK